MTRYLDSFRLARLAALTSIIAVSMLVASCSDGDKNGKSDNSESKNGELFVYNWYDFIAEDTVSNFEKKESIAITYDVYDTNEVLETKLLSGHGGYDLVFPSHDFLANQIKAGVYEPLDKSKLPNYGNLDPAIMKSLEAVDPGNRYGIPYLSQTTGLALNRSKVEQALGKDTSTDLNSWALIFKPENIKKLESCGVAFINAPTEIFSSALAYLGKDPNSKNTSDYQEAAKMLSEVLPHVRYFDSSRAMTDLANGDVCVTVTWTGDALIAAERASEAKNGVKIDYVIPKEGAGISIDMMAIPKDASNKENAYKFINNLLDAQVAADIVNYVYYPSPNREATPLISEKLRSNPAVYPPAEVTKTLWLFEPANNELRRLISREWTRLTTGS